MILLFLTTPTHPHPSIPVTNWANYNNVTTQMKSCSIAPGCYAFCSNYIIQNLKATKMAKIRRF